MVKVLKFYWRIVAMICMIAMLDGCNSYNVEPLPYDSGLVEVTVIENPNVAMGPGPVDGSYGHSCGCI